MDQQKQQGWQKTIGDVADQFRRDPVWMSWVQPDIEATLFQIQKTVYW